MKIIGLTGGIAMGKTTAANMLRHLGVPVHEADATVHRLYARGGAAVPLIACRFPEAVVQGRVDRVTLGQQVLRKPGALRDLEALMHPLVRAESQGWLRAQQRRRATAVVLDIPLLFETGRVREMNEIWLVDCAAFLQRQRAMARPGMTKDKLNTLLKRQWPQAKRRKYGDHIFPTGQGKAALMRLLKLQVSQLSSAGGTPRVDN